MIVSRFRWCFGLALLAATVTRATAAAPLWQIGRADHSDREFALTPGGFRQFQNDAIYVIGESRPEQDWPYVQPGPSDVWAGHRPHTFTVAFGLARVPAAGECRLILHLIDAQSAVPPKLRIEVNGEAFERTTTAGLGDDTLKGDPTKGRAQDVTVEFPATLLRRGDNAIQITTATGAWVIYDSLELQAPAGGAVTALGQRTIIASVQPVRALLSQGGTLVQPVDVQLRHFGDDARATVAIAGGAPVEVALTRGINTAEVLVPAVTRETELTVRVAIAGKPLGERTATVRPVRKLTLYVVPHSHTDIGYTQLQSAVEERQVQNLVDGMAAARNTAAYPQGARFVWNVEVLWAADLYLHRMNEAQRAAFVAAVKRGDVALNGMYSNELTGLCRPEELLRLFRFATELEQKCGMSIDTAMISDVPGYTWGTVTALAQAGIKYFSAAPNYFDRIGDSVVQWQDKPFYWTSPSGRDRVLVWVPFRGYALSHIYHDLSLRLLDDLQADLDRVDYPYDIAYTRWAGHGDNAVPDPAICEFIKAWNAKYAWPKLVISSASEAFHALEQRYAGQLPVMHGDWTPYWEDGAASSARETALNRNASDRLSEAEALWAIRGGRDFPAQAFDHAWRNVLLYSEHTWGAAGSVWDPLSKMTADQWAVKRGFAVHADAESTALLGRAVGEARSDVRGGASPRDGSAAESSRGEVSPPTSMPGSAESLRGRGTPPTAATIDVYNANSWPRTDLIVLSREQSAGRDRVVDASSRPVPSQRLATGELAFVARAVPPFGAARYTLHAGSAYATEQPARAETATLDNGLVQVRIDQATGAIAELHAAGMAGNLAGKGGLNDYLFLRGDDLANLEHNGRPTVTVVDAGPLVARLRIESTAPGCGSLTREVRVVAGFNDVEITNTVDKERAAIAPHPNDHVFAQKGGKESVNFAFPFNVPGGDLRIDLPIGSMRPAYDQIPGACKNWFTVGRWIDVANEEEGVTCVTLDAPLIEVGGITARLLGSQRDPSVWRQTVSPTTTFYSWVMNNHWGTNYRAYQEGPTVFRYVLRPHKKADYAAATRFAVGYTQPLVVAAADPSQPPLVGPRLRLSTDAVVVSSLKPSDDGRAWIIRLYGASGKDTPVSFRWTGPAPTAVSLSDTSEQPRERVDGPVMVPGWGIVTVRAERE